ncbi:hypothetical protein Q787_08120 [Ornithobacterium rhinotracheale H06-030791]|nr:hypothetical protein Q785_08310 [Ornithobacterium rhinotracheale ORT-UMN 88]KGB66189.1 hypothetical protein Q787_08120 [Ornithobacterium rhinotracheale H06-030791]
MLMACPKTHYIFPKNTRVFLKNTGVFFEGNISLVFKSTMSLI